MRAITENNLGTALQEQKRSTKPSLTTSAPIALEPDYAPALQQPRRGAARGGPADEAIAHVSAGARPQARFRSAATTSPTRCSSRARPAKRRAVPQRAADRRRLGRGAQQPRHRAGGQGRRGRGDRRVPRRARDRRPSAQAHRNLGDMLVDSGAARRGHGPFERAVRLGRTRPTRTTTSAASCCRNRLAGAAAAISGRR